MRPLVGPAALLLVASATSAQQTPSARGAVDSVLRSERFVAPAQSIVDAVLAPRYRNVSLTEINSERTWFINELGDGPVTMEVFSKPFHELGGLFLDFRAHRNRNLTIRSNVGLELIAARDGSTTPVALPAGVRISDAAWSPDGKSVAFFGHTPDGSHLWVADAATGKARQVTKVPVLATLTTGFEWTDDSRQLATVLMPEPRGSMPVESAVPTGPQVKLAEEKDKNRLRNYASLMATSHHQALLEWHTTGQVALVDVQTRAVTKIGQPAMVERVDVAPDGKYLRVTRMVKPFSYIVPVGNFGRVEELWSATGAVVAKLTEEPLNVGVDTSRTPTAPGVGGGDAARDGRREIVWRPHGPGLWFLEQGSEPTGSDTLAIGDERPRRKDRLRQWLPPFDSAQITTVLENGSRLSTLRFALNGKTVFLSERTGQNVHEFALFLAEPTKKYTVARYRADDVYANPGTLIPEFGLMPVANPFAEFGVPGRVIRPVKVSSDGERAFLAGTTYDRNPTITGPKTFIDRIELRTGEKTRLFESGNDRLFERVLAYQKLDSVQLIVSRESATEPPQSFRRDRDALVQLTQNVDPTPDLTRAPKESFIVERPDGFKFKVNVTLPPGYQPGTRLPAMFWFYPREYAGQAEYDRGARTFNRNAFQVFGARSMQILARAGYAVVEPDAPIVGSAGQMNNNYENDLRNNLAAVIDEIDRRGLVDRTRIGIGGHSYGAFSTVNAMAHTPFFKAGIAGDGNYNRTLTPLAFQSERRDLWEAKDTYLQMSPLLHANNLTGALLMYHGLGDQNVGTDPINSPRLFQALNGLGKPTAMYLYPFEDHGPATKETLLDLWGRWTAWLDKYVKNAGPKGKDVS